MRGDAVQVDADGTSIRRRPPRGVDTQPCGPMTFKVDTDADTGGDNTPRNILEEIVWFKAQEIEKWRLVTPAAQIAAQALQVLPCISHCCSKLLSRQVQCSHSTLHDVGPESKRLQGCDSRKARSDREARADSGSKESIAQQGRYSAELRPCGDCGGL